MNIRMKFYKQRALSRLVVFALMALSTTLRSVHAEKEDREIPLDAVTGMKMTGDWELVRNNCIICHSAQIFLRQKGTQNTWSEIIAWMQTDAGLWPLNSELERKIISYLATNYGPSDAHRRSPIPATLLPQNPYISSIKKEVEQKRKAGLIPVSKP